MEKYECLKLDNQLCFPLYACAKEIVRQYRKPLEAIGLTYTQYIVMMVLWEHDSLTEGEIGERVHLDSGTLAPLLKKLEKKGLLKRQRYEQNERKLIITLTKKGEKLKDKALSVPAAMQDCIDLPQEELIQLKELLCKALKVMNDNQI